MDRLGDRAQMGQMNGVNQNRMVTQMSQMDGVNQNRMVTQMSQMNGANKNRMMAQMGRMNHNERFLWNESVLGNNLWRDKILYGDVDEAERDLMYMREMYPLAVRYMQDAIEEELGRIDRAGSFIYDEYPDKYLFRRLVTKIMQIYMDVYMDLPENAMMDEAVLRDMITILVLNEIYRRRRKRWW